MAGMRTAGAVVRWMLEAMKRAVAPGVRTAELHEVGARVMRQHGARSAPALVYKFPGESSISVNEEAVHSIPSQGKLREGDLVKLDVTIEKNGLLADAAVTVPVGMVSEEKQRLMFCAERAFQLATRVARAGNCVSEIGGVVEHEVHRCGFSVIRELGGPGIGRTIHETTERPQLF